MIKYIDTSFILVI